MPPVLVDTHCHLAEAPLNGMVEAVLDRARAAGVVQCVVIGTSVASSHAHVTLAHRFPMLRATVGIHPHEADSVTDAAVAEMEALAGDERVVAIGEVGLDFFRQHAAPERQRDVFRAFIGVAQRRKLPLVIHCREAYEPLLEILRTEARSPVRGVIHCASGPAEFIQGALALGLHISFSGTVTFPNAQATRTLVPLVPDDRLLIETDAPFLAPQVHRGKRNEPFFMLETARQLAELKGISIEKLGEAVTQNSETLFNRPFRSKP